MSLLRPREISASQLDSWIKTNTNNPFFIDVREEQELAIAKFPFQYLHLPLSKMQEWEEKLFTHLPTERPIVVICHSGIRSENFGIWLLGQRENLEVWNLVGGIDSWSLNVDPSITRY